jgi:hypothetical protein
VLHGSDFKEQEEIDPVNVDSALGHSVEDPVNLAVQSHSHRSLHYNTLSKTPCDMQIALGCSSVAQGPT